MKKQNEKNILYIKELLGIKDNNSSLSDDIISYEKKVDIYNSEENNNTDQNYKKESIFDQTEINKQCDIIIKELIEEKNIEELTLE